MTTCEHHCGDPVYRVLGPSFNTRSWVKWMREHGVPVSQVPVGSEWSAWVRRDETANQVTVLVFDWGDTELEKAPSAALTPDLPADEIFCERTAHVIREGKPGEWGAPKLREFVSQLNRAPDPFPTSSDCGQDGREPAIAGGVSRADYYEHRPLQ